jgi:hypothetical protein
MIGVPYIIGVNQHLNALKLDNNIILVHLTTKYRYVNLW